MVGKEPFALVAVAQHMPRAMEIFEAFGLRPVACPYDFTARKLPAFDVKNLYSLYKWVVPDANSLRGSHSAIHEYVGIFWFRIRKKLAGLPSSQ